MIHDPQAGLLQSLPQRLVFRRAQLLAIPHRIRARLKIQERCQLLTPSSRQRLRLSKHVNGVERDDAQDS